ncbi:hypothetical protein [Nocardioides currus]|uniref:TetR family transcriptional regulator n=1 Tax=Nocardioides currus TaxID=2133958 RepID=A0A2R7YXD3_9ACTN|nr:hypothetical protein [Nocardioides currus]PUA81027.1 hypothetical protein C7S10_11660 [Nocardioides currus]
MTWTSFHHRGDVLRAVITQADARRDGLLPMDVDGVAETFRDELTLLGALALRWHTRLAGRIERELMTQPMDLEGAVLAAWQATAAELPGVRAILDRYRAEPLDAEMARAMTTSAAKEHVLLSVMAGRASARDDGAAAAGERIAERARASLTVPAPRAASGSPSLVERLRAVLTAA